MFLVQISDTHLLPLRKNNPLSFRRAEQLERCVSAINELPFQPEAVVHTGDMINFGPDNGYELAFEILSKLKPAFFPAIGNRDARAEMIRQFHPHISSYKGARFCQYRVQLKSADLICVDTKSDVRNVGTTCTKRLAQIKELLQEDTSRPVLLFMHHPPIPIKALKNPLQFDTIEHARALTKLFDRYDNIARILCGHTHRSDMLKMGCHWASTHPSLATDVRLDDYPEWRDDEPVFQVHELHDDHTVTSASYLVGEPVLVAAQ